jgi:hypothetical protein
MISKGHVKTKAEKDWLDVVVEFAGESDFLCDTYGHITSNYKHFEIDHIIGAKAKRKINGVSLRVGELAIMPVPYSLHNIRVHHPDHRANPGRYRKRFGHEKQVWLTMIRVMQNECYEIPFSEEVIQAIIR